MVFRPIAPSSAASSQDYRNRHAHNREGEYYHGKFSIDSNSAADGNDEDDNDDNGICNRQDGHVKLTRATILFAVCASVNSCNLGYDIGVSTEAGRLVQEDLGLSQFQRELFTGSINFWGSKLEQTPAGGGAR
jgi:hypothetical protein